MLIQMIAQINFVIYQPKNQLDFREPDKILIKYSK